MSLVKPAQRVFEPMREPFTIAEIAAAIGVSWHAVNYAYLTLGKREATREIVRAVDGRKPTMLDARAADLIARHVQSAARRKKAPGKAATNASGRRRMRGPT